MELVFNSREVSQEVPQAQLTVRAQKFYGPLVEEISSAVYKVLEYLCRCLSFLALAAALIVVTMLLEKLQDLALGFDDEVMQLVEVAQIVNRDNAVCIWHRGQSLRGEHFLAGGR